MVQAGRGNRQLSGHTASSVRRRLRSASEGGCDQDPIARKRTGGLDERLDGTRMSEGDKPAAAGARRWRKFFWLREDRDGVDFGQLLLGTIISILALLLSLSANRLQEEIQARTEQEQRIALG